MNSMGEPVTPEKFVVGETVGYYHGADLIHVKVTEVEGDTVVVGDYAGNTMTFVFRESDGQHVRLGTPDDEEMPDIIFHHLMFSPVKTVESGRSDKPKNTKTSNGVLAENVVEVLIRSTEGVIGSIFN